MQNRWSLNLWRLLSCVPAHRSSKIAPRSTNKSFGTAWKMADRNYFQFKWESESQEITNKRNEMYPLPVSVLSDEQMCLSFSQYSCLCQLWILQVCLYTLSYVNCSDGVLLTLLIRGHLKSVILTLDPHCTGSGDVKQQGERNLNFWWPSYVSISHCGSVITHSWLSKSVHVHLRKRRVRN